MIKDMSKKQKMLLNDMVQTILYHQQKNEEEEINVTKEKRKFIQTQQRLFKAQQEKLAAEIELNKFKISMQETQKNVQKLFPRLQMRDANEIEQEAEANSKSDSKKAKLLSKGYERRKKPQNE